MKRRCMMWSFLALLVGIVGCGAGDVATYSVSGTVKFEDGTPVKRGQVLFTSFEPKDLRVEAHGEIEKDGSFTLTTYEPGDGAPAGKYKVSFVGTDMSAEAAAHVEGDEPSPGVAKKYTSNDTTDITKEVLAEDNTFQIVVPKAAAGGS